MASMKIHPNEIRRFVGNMEQFSNIREMTVENGRSRGMRIYQVQAGNGLEFDLLPDKALDIARLTYKGININWQAKTGFASPVFASPVLNEFDRYFSGGMLLTCGLKNTGPDHVDSMGRFQPLHGRIGITPCERSWYNCFFTEDDYCLEAGGVVRDALLCSHNLTITRVIRTFLSKSEIEITDTLQNEEPCETDYLILYHFNFGYPFLTPSVKIEIPEGEKPVEPRTEWAAKGIEYWKRMEPPEDEYEEQCYFHHPESGSDGFCMASITNPDLGVKVRLSYQNENLPVLTEWKSIRAGEYVLGIEPGNSYLTGMENEKLNGHIGKIGGFEKREFRMKLAFS